MPQTNTRGITIVTSILTIIGLIFCIKIPSMAHLGQGESLTMKWFGRSRTLLSVLPLVSYYLDFE